MSDSNLNNINEMQSSHECDHQGTVFWNMTPCNKCLYTVQWNLLSPSNLMMETEGFRNVSVRFIRGHLIYYEIKYFIQDFKPVPLDFQTAWNERCGLVWFRTGIWKFRVFRSGVKRGRSPLCRDV